MKAVGFSLSRVACRILILLPGILMSLGLVAERAAAQPAPDPCRPVRFADSAFVVCTVDLRRYDVRLFWRGPDGCQSASKFDPRSASNSDPASINAVPPFCGFIRSGS